MVDRELKPVVYKKLLYKQMEFQDHHRLLFVRVATLSDKGRGLLQSHIRRDLQPIYLILKVVFLMNVLFVLKHPSQKPNHDWRNDVTLCRVD